MGAGGGRDLRDDPVACTLSRPGAILVLEDGRTFTGHAYGAVGTTTGEAVFATGMTGYQETLTDPSYHRQIVVMTAPHIGNTGINAEDPESDRIWVAGFAVRDPAPRPSSWRAQGALEDELAAQGVVGICDLDTRALTRHLRVQGAMRAGIFSGQAAGLAVPELLAEVRATARMAGSALADEVTVTAPVRRYSRPAPVPGRAGAQESADPGPARLSVALVDLGIKEASIRALNARGVAVEVLPADAGIEDVLAVAGVRSGHGPDGVFFSNGPGDPATADAQVDLLRAVLARRIPFFGICLGNQILGRALGFGTYKLPFGHRGINQPVLSRATGRIAITAHNHGFAVDAPREDVVPAPADATGATCAGRVRVSHICLNDNVVEGLECLDTPAFSVQFHPEAAAGPHDSQYLFDDFVALMTRAGGAADAQ